MADPISSAPAAPVVAPVAESTPSTSVNSNLTPAEAALLKTDPTLEVKAPEPVSKAPEAVKQAEKQLKKLKLKIDGKEIEEAFDPNDDEYLTRQFQMAKMGQKRASEAAQLQKEVAAFIQELKTNPRKVLSDPNIGIDVKQLAAQVIEEEIENSKKSPEQLEKERLQAELEELRAQQAREKEEMSKKEFERLQAQEYERYDMLMTKALEKSDLPKSPYVVKKMADYMLLSLQKGVDLPPEDVLPLVRQEIQNDIKEMFAVMPDDAIAQIVGKDVIGRIRKNSVAKAKQAPPPQPLSKGVKDTGEKSAKDEGPKKKISMKEFFGI